MITDGFRIYRGVDGKPAIDQIVDGMVYPLEIDAERRKLDYGYYDPDFNFVEPDDEIEKANPNHDDRGRFATGEGGGGAGGTVDDGGLKQYLEMASKMGSKIDEYVLAHGRAFATDQETFQGGKAQQCYKNATTAVMADSENLTYVEGYISVHGVPIAHAWAVTKEGTVRDVTLGSSEGIKGYFGVPIKTDTLYREVARNKVYGILTGQSNPRAVQRLIESNPKDVVEG